MTTGNKTIETTDPVVETIEKSPEETTEVKVDTRTPEQIKEDIAKSFKTNDVVDDSEVEIEETIETTTKKEKETKVETSTYNPIWDVIKSEVETQNGEGSFKLPEFTPETEHKVLLDFIAKSLEPDFGDIPDEAKEIIELHKKGLYDPDKYASKKEQIRSIEKMSSDDLLFNVYKQNHGKTEENPDGYTDEDITEYLKVMPKIAKDREANELREAIKKQYNDTEVQTKISNLSREKQIEELNNNKIELTKKLIETNKDNVDFFGIQASKAEVEEYQKVFPDLVKLDPATGSSKLVDWLQSDQVLYQLGFLFHKGSDYLKNKVAAEKKEVKEKIDSKLGNQSDLNKTGLDQTKVRTFDINKFKGATE